MPSRRRPEPRSPPRHGEPHKDLTDKGATSQGPVKPPYVDTL